MMIYKCLLSYTIGHDNSTATGWRTTLVGSFGRLLQEDGIEIEVLDEGPTTPHTDLLEYVLEVLLDGDLVT
jgi:hypothetical protein